MIEELQNEIKISIIECYQTTIDIYALRFLSCPNIKIIASSLFADEFDESIFLNTNVLMIGSNIRLSNSKNTPISMVFFIKKIKEINPKIKIIIIAEFVDNQQIINYFQAGMDGLICKNDQQSIIQLDEIVDLVNKGGIFFDGEFKIDFHFQ